MHWTSSRSSGNHSTLRKILECFEKEILTIWCQNLSIVSLDMLESRFTLLRSYGYTNASVESQNGLTICHLHTQLDPLCKWVVFERLSPETISNANRIVFHWYGNVPIWQIKTCGNSGISVANKRDITRFYILYIGKIPVHMIWSTWCVFMFREICTDV